MPPAPRKGGGKAGKSGGGAGGKGGRRTDAEDAMEDAVAEVADLHAALDSDEQAGAALLPDGHLQRRLDKKTAEKEKETAAKEKAIKEKELLQKQLDEANAALELAKANVGDIMPITPSSCKVRFLHCFCFVACLRYS